MRSRVMIGLLNIDCCLTTLSNHASSLSRTVKIICKVLKSCRLCLVVGAFDLQWMDLGLIPLSNHIKDFKNGTH